MKTITTIILAHYKEREMNLKQMIDDLLSGTIVPEKIILFIDNPEIKFEDERVTILRSSKPFLPIVRFALGSGCDTEYCFFLDDDLTVRKKTLEYLVFYAEKFPKTILGFEGSILGQGDTPYSNDMPKNRGNYSEPFPVDILIRTYFVPTVSLMAGLLLRVQYPFLPQTSLDDVFLCLGNKYINNKENYIIPVDEETDLTELSDGGVGQSLSEDHYKHRNMACRLLMDKYL